MVLVLNNYNVTMWWKQQWELNFYWNVYILGLSLNLKNAANLWQFRSPHGTLLQLEIHKQMKRTIYEEMLHIIHQQVRSPDEKISKGSETEIPVDE